MSDGEKRREQKLIIGLFVALVAASAVVAPMMLSGGDQPQVDPKEGSVTTPQPTATPDQQPSLDRERPDLSSARLASIPESHSTATASDGPPVPDSVSASAGAQTMRVETTTVDGEPALQLSDSTQHEGRWVSIETAWLENNLGAVPDTVTVAHDSNGTYVSDLRVRQDSAAFYVEEFSTNTITFGGEISATGTYTDGSSFGYDISSLDAASDFTIDATGVAASEWDNQTAAQLANGDLLDLAIAGTQVTDQSITLTGEETTSSGSASATGATDGSSTTTGISSDAEAIRDGSVTFAGQSSTTTATDSGTDGDTLSVGGNLDASGTLTLEGDGTTTSNDVSATGLSVGDSVSAPTSGNLAPTGPANGEPALSVTAYAEGSETSLFQEAWSSTEASSSYDADIGTVSGLMDGLRIVRGSSPVGQTTVDIYANVGETADGDPDDGTLVASGVTVENSDTTVAFDNPVAANGEQVSIGIVITGSNQLDVMYDNVGSATYYADGNQNDRALGIFAQLAPADVTVSGDDGTTVSLGGMADGATKTVPFAATEDLSSLSVSATGGTFDLTLDKDDRTGTEDPSATIDGQTYSATGIYQSGETATFDLSLSPGSRTVSTSSTSGPTPTWSTSLTETTATEDPGLDLDGDGTTDVSHSGVLMSGETSTVSIPDSAIDPSTSSVVTALSGGSVDWSADWTRVDYTEDPVVTLPDGTAIASHSGLLAPGETTTTQLDGALSTSTDSLTIETAGGTTVGATASFRERSPTQDLTLSVNGNEVSHSGTIADGETVSLATNTSWLQSGTNTVDVSLASASSDAPTPQVALDYSHSLSDRVSVNYQGEAFSERYNVSRSYASDRSDATLTIPHADEVLSIRNLDYQVDGGGWQQMPEGAATLDNTTLRVNMSALAGEPIPESTTIDIRSTASKVQVDGGEISVLQPTAVGFDLNSRIRLESWSDGASIALGGTPQGSLVHYATDESYSEEDDYAVLDADGSQRLYLPAATDGSELSIKTLPVEASPETNTIELRVPDDANATNIEMAVSGGPVVGDSWTATYVGATEGAWYGVFGENGDRLARTQAPDSLTVARDDVGLVSIEGAQPPSEDEPETAGAALFSTLGGPTFLPLIVIFGGIGAIGLAGRRPEQSRESIAGLADSIGGLISAVPRVGPAIASPVEDLVTGVGDAAVSIGESEIAVGGIAVIATVAAEQANLFSVGPQVAAISAIGVVAVGSLIALRRTDSFSIQLWGGIVGAATLVALQTLGETDLIGAVVNSDAFLFVALGGLYLAYRGISAWQASEQAENAPPEITIDASSLQDGEGGDDK